MILLTYRVFSLISKAFTLTNITSIVLSNPSNLALKPFKYDEKSVKNINLQIHKSFLDMTIFHLLQVNEFNETFHKPIKKRTLTRSTNFIVKKYPFVHCPHLAHQILKYFKQCVEYCGILRSDKHSRTHIQYLLMSQMSYTARNASRYK